MVSKEEHLEEHATCSCANNKKNKDEIVTVIKGHRIELPCIKSDFMNSSHFPNPASYTWVYGNHSQVTENDHLHVNSYGNLVISYVNSQYDVFTCAFRFTDPNINKNRIFTTTYYLNVLMLPSMNLITEVHYTASEMCDDALLVMIKLFLPQLIQNDICYRNNESDICYITAKNALCIGNKSFDTNETNSSDVSINYHVSIPPITSFFTVFDDALCNENCLQMLAFKLLVSLNRSVSTALSIPVKMNSNIELTPKFPSISRFYSLSCEAGFHLHKKFCVACDVGTYSKEGSAFCHPCSKGQYQPKRGSGSCIPCPSPFVRGCRYLVLEQQSIAGTVWVFWTLMFIIIALLIHCCFSECKNKHSLKDMQAFILTYEGCLETEDIKNNKVRKRKYSSGYSSIKTRSNIGTRNKYSTQDDNESSVEL